MKILNKKLGVTASYLSILLSASLLITGCKKDFLDVPPQAQQPVTQFWPMMPQQAPNHPMVPMVL